MTIKKASDLVLPEVEMDPNLKVIPCAMCGNDSGWKPEVFYNIAGGNFKAVLCNDCYNIKAREWQDEQPVVQSQEYHNARWEDMVPALYRETEVKKLPEQAKILWEHLKDWSITLGKGIDILGASRTGKTRTMCLILEKLHKEKIPFKLFLAGQFNAQLADAKRSSFYKQWRDEVVNIPVLAIDDLFSEKLTDTTQAGLFEIIEQRMANKKILLITRQVKRSEAVRQFTDPRRCESLFNRIKETCDPYRTNKDDTEEIKYGDK
jgi:endogenous inhibitor of DNA gyrase (YacG/DUF329 family)